MGSSKLIQSIKAIFEDQLLAVLSTREGDQPYSNLVCFAATDDLRCLVFATPRATRKYANIEGGFRVAMLVDNRANEAADIDKATAVTVLGTAREVRGEEREDLLARYLGRHPHLESFCLFACYCLVQGRGRQVHRREQVPACSGTEHETVMEKTKARAGPACAWCQCAFMIERGEI